MKSKKPVIVLGSIAFSILLGFLVVRLTTREAGAFEYLLLTLTFIVAVVVSDVQRRSMCENRLKRNREAERGQGQSGGRY